MVDLSWVDLSWVDLSWVDLSWVDLSWHDAKQKAALWARLAVIANLKASSLSRPNWREETMASREDQRLHGGEVIGSLALDVNAVRPVVSQFER
ncbi:MAG: hypothetical protein J2P50_01130 [Hyphomicrobiaceae bacterium]|nr:hypothetical protein [Hyphomicrobiaceae bacterium]